MKAGSTTLRGCVLRVGHLENIPRGRESHVLPSFAIVLSYGLANRVGTSFGTSGGKWDAVGKKSRV